MNEFSEEVVFFNRLIEYSVRGCIFWGTIKLMHAQKGRCSSNPNKENVWILNSATNKIKVKIFRPKVVSTSNKNDAAKKIAKIAIIRIIEVLRTLHEVKLQIK